MQKKWASGAHLQEYSQNHDATKKPTMLSTLSLEEWQTAPAIYEINKTQFIIHWWAITIVITNWIFLKKKHNCKQYCYNPLSKGEDQTSASDHFFTPQSTQHYVFVLLCPLYSVTAFLLRG